MSLTTERPIIVQTADTLPPALVGRPILYHGACGRTAEARLRRYRHRDGRTALLVLTCGAQQAGANLAGNAFYAAWVASGCPWPCRCFEHWPATSESALPDDPMKGETITELCFPQDAARGPHTLTHGHVTAFLEPSPYDLTLGEFWILTHPTHHTGQMPTWVIYGYPPDASSADQGRYFRLEPGKTFDWPRWVEERERAHWCPTAGDVIIAQEIARGERWTVRVRQLAAWEVQP